MISNSLPSNYQHVFCPQHGIDTVTTTIFVLVNRLIESKKKVTLVTLNKSAAFDRLDKFIFDTKAGGSWISRKDNCNQQLQLV
jgi:hypothetical protein